MSSYKREHLDAIASMEDMHSHKEQIDRQKRARETKCTPLSVDKENRKGTFRSSRGKPYSTNVISEFTYNCTCKDFGMRGLPCKHIYRLWHEFDIFSLDKIQSHEIEISEAETFNVELKIDFSMKTLEVLAKFGFFSLDEIGYEFEPIDAGFDPIFLKELSETEQKELYDLLNLWINRSAANEWVYEKGEVNCQKLIDCGFLEIIDMPEKLLKMKNISELRVPLKEAGLKGFPTKESVIQALLKLNPNAADDMKQQYIVVRFQTKWEEIRGKIRTYLKNKLPRKEKEILPGDMGEREESWAHFIS